MPDSEQVRKEKADRFLAAGVRLLARGLGLGDGDEPATIFEWLSRSELAKEAKVGGAFSDGKWPTEETVRNRWKDPADYRRDLISHILSLYHWDWQKDIMGESAKVLTDEGDLVDAIQIVCYSDLKTLVDSPVQRILPLVTILISKDRPSFERRAEHYRQVRDEWTKLFEATFALYNIRLRPGIDIQEAADILTALADGLAMRATGDPEAQVINRTPGDSLLGRAATMMLLAGIDPGDHLSLKDALRQATSQTETTD